MKRVFVIFLVLILLFTAKAGPIDRQKALSIAQNFWASQVKTPATFLDVTAQTQFQGMYIFTTVDGGGFVIVAADDCAKPILGYSRKGSFSTTDIPPAVSDWLIFYEQQIQWAKTNGVTSAKTQNEWRAWLQPSGGAPKYASSVEPLLTTTWSQRPWYNEMCPIDSTLYSGHPTTGCTATGMAQVMKYWNHPRHGYGSYSYSWEGVQPHWTYGTLSADFENTFYDWENMTDALDGNSTATQVNAVAQLMSHVGISIQMSYNLYGEGSSDAPVALLEFTDSMYLDHTYCPENALPKFFGYKPTLRGLSRVGYADTIWDNMLREDISNGRPVLYGGFGIDPLTGVSNGGHCFVLDGYDQNGLFHVNWGWGGAYDAYFPTSALNVAGYSFSDRQEALFGIEPDHSYLEMTESLNQLVLLSPNTLTTNFGFGIQNKGDSAFVGKLGIGVWDENQHFMGLMTQELVTINPSEEYYGPFCNIPYLPNLELNKTYKAVLMYGDTLPEYPVFETASDLNHVDFIVTNSGIEEQNGYCPVVAAQNSQILIKDEKMSPIMVYNTAGSMIYQNATPQAETRIPVKTAGIYLVQVGSHTAKIIIQ